MAKDRRMVIVLKCEECKEENYSTTVKRDDYKDFQRAKYCNRCQEHTTHNSKKPPSNRK